MEEPRCSEFRMDMRLPKRQPDRSERLEPRYVLSQTESVFPTVTLPMTLALDDSRVYVRIDTDELMITKLRTDTRLPRRPDPRRESEEPRAQQPFTESFRTELIPASPKTLTEEPHLTKPRTLNVDPRCAYVMVENLLLNLATPRKLRLLPKLTC
jgi:hypothetical protein